MELALGIVDQTRVAAELQPLIRHFQLHGKIQFTFQPGLHDQLPTIADRVGNPAAMRFQNLRLEQTHRIAARQTKRFLDHDFMMPALADCDNGGECFIQRIHGHANFVFGAKPRLVGRAALLRRLFVWAARQRSPTS